MAENHKSGWALDSNLKRIHIIGAKRGANGYICPICHKELIAKKGEVNSHHFAHRETPNHAGESALHFFAKTILAEMINQTKKFDYKKELEVKEYSEKYQTPLNQVFDLRQYSVFPKIISAEVEKALNSEITPDVTVNLEDGRAYFIEIYVTSKKSKQRIKDLKNLDVSVIEIDLSRLSFDASEEEIRKALNNHDLQNWLHLADKDFPAREKAFKQNAERYRMLNNTRAVGNVIDRAKERDSEAVSRFNDLNWLKSPNVN